MRWAAFLAATALAAPAFGQSLPSPAFAGLSTTGNATIGGTLGVTGTSSFGNTLNVSAGGITVTGGVQANILNSSASSNALVWRNGPGGNIMMQVGGAGNQIIPQVEIALQGGTWGSNASGSALLNGRAPLFQNATFTGTTAGAGAAFGAFLQQTDNGTGSEGTNLGFEEHLIVTGPNITGGRNGGAFYLDINGIGANTVESQDVALLTKCNLNVSDSNGLAVCFGFNAVASSGANVTSEGVVGAEIDTWMQSGSVARDRLGIQIVDVTGSTFGVQATRDDQMLSLNNQYSPTSSRGYKIGIGFGRSGGNFPLATNGTMIYGVGNVGASWTVGNGIDWHLGTATGNWIQFGSVFSIDGTGIVTGASYKAGATAGVTCSGTPTSSFASTGGIVTHC